MEWNELGYTSRYCYVTLSHLDLLQVVFSHGGELSQLFVCHEFIDDRFQADQFAHLPAIPGGDAHEPSQGNKEVAHDQIHGEGGAEVSGSVDQFTQVPAEWDGVELGV